MFLTEQCGQPLDIENFAEFTFRFIDDWLLVYNVV